MTVPEVLRAHFARRVVIGLHRIPEFFDALLWSGAYQSPDFGDWYFPQSGVELFCGIDATKCPPPPWWTELPGMWGCNESHKAVIARALSDGLPNVLIMEDDCRFTPEAAALMTEFIKNVPADWDAILFGGQVSDFDGRTEPVAPLVSRCVQVERLHCYALSRKGMIAFYHALCEPGSCLPNDYRFGDLQEQGKLATYRIEPFVAYQAEGPSAISGRVEPSRVWDDRVNVRVRDPKDVPIVSLVCPFEVFDRLRREGLVANGGESPPQYATIEPGRVECGELAIAEVTLRTAQQCPEAFAGVIAKLRNEAAYHRSAVLTLWHPETIIPFAEGGTIVAQTYEQVKAELANNPSWTSRR